MQVPVPGTSKVSGELCSTFNFIINLRQAAEMGTALGKPEAANLSNVANNYVEQFNDAFYNKDKHCWDNCGQSSYALAIGIEAYKAEDLPGITKDLVANILDKNKNHVETGIIGLKSLYPALTKLKQQSVAVSLGMDGRDLFQVLTTIQPSKRRSLRMAS